jgi:hypothetical protein
MIMSGFFPSGGFGAERNAAAAQVNQTIKELASDCIPTNGMVPWIRIVGGQPIDILASSIHNGAHASATPT